MFVAKVEFLRESFFCKGAVIQWQLITVEQGTSTKCNLVVAMSIGSIKLMILFPVVCVAFISGIKLVISLQID